MTDEELSDACQKFRDYLHANGRRTVAMVMATDVNDGPAPPILAYGDRNQLVATACAVAAAFLDDTKLYKEEQR